MDRETVWQHLRAERHALARLLATLTPQQWEQPSLCPGWTVRHVAAHVISIPQIGWLDVLRMTPAMVSRGPDRAMDADVQARARATPAQILEQYARFGESRRHAPVTSHVEPLLDVLVHTQDIVRPLGLDHPMPPAAAAFAADRARRLAGMLGSRRVVGAVTMQADDVDWRRGEGPEVVGPVAELLMLCAGRAAHLDRLRGPGVGQLAAAHPAG